MRLLAVILGLVMLVGCSSPTNEQISADLRRMHPGCTLESASPGEGDSDTVYVRVKYRCPGNARVRAEDLMYRRSGDEWDYAGDV